MIPWPPSLTCVSQLILCGFAIVHLWGKAWSRPPLWPSCRHTGRHKTQRKGERKERQGRESERDRHREKMYQAQDKPLADVLETVSARLSHAGSRPSTLAASINRELRGLQKATSPGPKSCSGDMSKNITWHFPSTITPDTSTKHRIVCSRKLFILNSRGCNSRNTTYYSCSKFKIFAALWSLWQSQHCLGRGSISNQEDGMRTFTKREHEQHTKTMLR